MFNLFRKKAVSPEEQIITHEVGHFIADYTRESWFVLGQATITVKYTDPDNYHGNCKANHTTGRTKEDERRVVLGGLAAEMICFGKNSHPDGYINDFQEYQELGGKGSTLKADLQEVIEKIKPFKKQIKRITQDILKTKETIGETKHFQKLLDTDYLEEIGLVHFDDNSEELRQIEEEARELAEALKEEGS